MKKKCCLVSPLLLILLICGCYSAAEVMKTTQDNLVAKEPAAVKLFLADKPADPYKEIGRVSVKKYGQYGRSKPGAEIHQLLKDNAASIGGDAIINITEDFASISGVIIVFTPKAEQKEK